MALLEGSKVARPAFVQLTKDEQEKLINMINSGLENVAEKLSPDEFLTLARAFIGVAHDAVQNAKEPFEGIGNLRQTHYMEATNALATTNVCMLRLQELLTTTSHLPEAIAPFNEQLIFDIRSVIAVIGTQSPDSQHQYARMIKEDVGKWLQQLLLKLDELDSHIQGRDLPW